ncbi:MAG: hypothetical protein QM667_10075 [Asticcacaulis sp.]
MLRHLKWLAIAMALTGCQKPDEAVKIPPDATLKDGQIIRKTPVPIYPQAYTVKLYVSDKAPMQDGFRLDDASAITLSQAQRSKLASAFSYIDVLDTVGPVPDEIAAACFEPHHFFRYYDKAGHMIGEIQLCFCCARAIASPEVFTDKAYKDYTRREKRSDVDLSIFYDLIDEMGLNPTVGCG